MEKELVKGKIGAVGEYEVAAKIEEGKLKLISEVALSGDTLVDYVVNAAAKAIPGDFELPLLEVVRAAAKKALAGA
jgi:hypothetical protein